MNAWERFRKWAASFIWPDCATEVEQLTARLAAVHGRMQDLYWDGKAKEMAYSRIAGLEDALWRACVALAISGQEEASKKFCEESGILWREETIARWRRMQPLAGDSEGLAFDHPGRHGSWPDPETAPDALNIKMGKGETIEPQTLDPDSPIMVYAGCSVCMKPRPECTCPEGFHP